MSTGFEKDFEAQLEALTQLEALQKEKEELLNNRATNLPKSVITIRAKNEERKKNLKSDLKKSNAFVKKLKSINSEGIQQCIRDCDAINLTQFISEITNAIVATTFKATDCNNMVKLCVCLHQKYEQFTDPLVSGIKASLLSPPAENDNESGKRKRIQIRFLIELFQAGMFIEEEFFVTLLRNLIGKPSRNNSGPPAKTVMDIQSLSTFVKYGSEVLMGFIPRKYIDLAAKAEKPIEDIPLKILASARVTEEMKLLISETFEKLSTDMVKAHSEYRKKELKAEKDGLIHGSLTEQKQLELENSKKLFEKLFSIATTLSECMNVDMPVLKVEKEEEDGSKGLTVIVNSTSPDESAATGGIHGDPETWAFYEQLPDILSLVPLTVLGLTPEQAAEMRQKWETVESTEPSSEPENPAEEPTSKDSEPTINDKQQQESEKMSGENVKDEKVNEENDDFEGEKADSPDVEESRSAKLHALLNEKLLEVVNKAKADEFCTSFCYLSTKASRKKLAYTLGRVPRGRSELVGTFARILASLRRLYPDSELVNPVLESLSKEFYGMLKTKGQFNIESKIRNVRYQGELIKFKVAPPIVAFRMFKALLSDFTQHNVELLAVLLETCGRFLYLTPHASEKMNEILDTMMRLRRAKNLDLHQQNLLESAYFAVKPPERAAKGVKKVKSPLQRYVLFLIQEKLDDMSASVEYVIKCLRRLPWQSTEENVTNLVIKAVLKVSRTKYVSIPNVADCVSGLQRYTPNLTVQLVDRIFEEIQRGLEGGPRKRDVQRMLGLVRLLGELYNYTAVSSTIIFELLYHLINYSHSEIVPLNSVDVTNTLNQAVVAPGAASGSCIAFSIPAGTIVIDPLSPGNNPSHKGTVGKIKFDPINVISDKDPPNDLFRAQIVCELLTTCGSYYVRGQAKLKLTRFLTFFQRYLLTKQMVPLHVEFLILDTFDHLEEEAQQIIKSSQQKANRQGKPSVETIEIVFPRYDTLESVQIAIEEYEKHIEDDTVERDEGNDQFDDEDDDDDEEEENNDDLNNEGEEVDDDDEDSDDDEGDSEDQDDEAEAEEERRAALMMEKMRIVEEDEEFDLAFKQVMQESVSGASTKGNDLSRMAVPAVLPKPKNLYQTTTMDEDENSEENEGGEGYEGGDKEKGKKIAFKLLSRDNKGRFETRQLMVPKETEMATKLMKAEEELRLEKQKLKERVLQIDKLTNEQEYEPSDIRYIGHNNREYFDHPPPPARGFNQPQYGGKGGNYSRGRGPSGVRANETRRPADTLNLDQFLNESNAAELRKLSDKYNNSPQQGPKKG